MKARYWGRLAVLLASVLAVFSVAQADPQLPVRTGAVVDVADIIRANQEQALAANASNLKAMSNVELVVVTLPSLQGYSIERWGRDLGNGWDVGGSAARGVLLIVAPNDREVRIEVGDALGSSLSDRTASAIIDNVIVPQFRSGEMSGGILAGVDAIAKAVTRQGASATTRQPAPAFEPTYRRETDWSGLKIVLVVVLMIFVSVIGAARGATRDEGGSGYFGRRGSYRSSWSSSRSSFSSGRSSRSFSGRGASGRW